MSGSAGAQIISLSISIAVARILGREDLGKFAIIQSTIAMYTVFGGAGLGLASTKFVAQYNRTDTERTGRIMGMALITGLIFSILVSGAIYSFTPYIAANYLKTPFLVDELKIVSLLVSFIVIDGIQVGILAGLEKFKSIASTNLIRSVVQLLATIPLVLFFNIKGAILAIVLTTLSTCLINYHFVSKACKERKIKANYNVKNQAEWLSFINFCVPSFIGSFLGVPVMWLANTFLISKDEGFVQMGFYAIATQFRTAIMFFPRKVIEVALPLMSSVLDNEEETSRVNRIYEITQSISALVILPVITLLLFSSSFILSVYGEEFLEARDTLSIMLFATSISVLGSGAGALIQAKGRMWFGLFTNILWSLIFLFSSYIFTIGMKAAGISLALAIANAVLLAITLFATYKVLNLALILKVSYSFLMLLGLTICSIYLDVNTQLIISVPISFLVLFVAYKFLISMIVKDKISYIFKLQQVRLKKNEENYQ